MSIENFKGTKGIWEIGFEDRFSIGIYCNKKPLLNVKVEEDRAEAKANTLLISKSPELLKTLFNLHQAISSGNPHLLSEWSLKAKTLTHEILNQ